MLKSQMPTICPLRTGMTVKASLTASETTRPASQNLFNKELTMVKTNPAQSNNTLKQKGDRTPHRRWRWRWRWRWRCLS
ncbi:hypothetical protein LC613_35910 [Nostoc sphaeroides CHAB 2801]|uniref:hypothetical protein n=1 Tax=Nostoc sphaeroides TaxID=446679 RepID=UPI001E39D57A|nr:hypothetical protein [Nostoc sphaeroides]MCC5632456.1 hypothetical protein [Nostoc sphaeroides CHAB 2801]MCC5632924.1 hypothetical protein [Nostoc sphaeroides CHAB 2801]